MTESVLDIAIAEAERFIAKAYVAKNSDLNAICGSKERSSVKRSSMDLSRALSALRKANTFDWRTE
jgi:hypothetical protein